MQIKMISADDPITVAIDRECDALLLRLCGELNLDGVSVVCAMTMLLNRQLMHVDAPRAALFVRTFSQEMAANFSDPAARERRVVLIRELSEVAREKAAAMAEAHQARAAGKIS